MFDVIVVGGGHAGCEAAAAAARLGARTALVTQSAKSVGAMSCNPSFGGVGKGHLIREIDALGGLMGRCADSAAIHFRTLNTSRGAAVQAPRCQADRPSYAAAIQAELAGLAPHLSVVEGEVTGLNWTESSILDGILLNGRPLRAPRVVLATGTFLGGRLLRAGESVQYGGRMEDAQGYSPPIRSIREDLLSRGLSLGRLRTGTPPRVKGSSLDLSRATEQFPDDPVDWFSFSNCGRPAPTQVSCWLTHTTEETHRLVELHMHDSPQFDLTREDDVPQGPRYCPSLEMKVARFRNRPRHPVFLEPESLDLSARFYPQGMSMGLPRNVQDLVMRSIPAMEHCELEEYGYSVEYDYVDPRGLHRWLECRSIPGLYLAGQINGTTGYEEAAAQGLLAGTNAALSLNLPSSLFPYVPDRADGYLGVLVDDLVSHGAPEPYRMFTSRAEYRLSLRADTADLRLTDHGLKLGLVSPAQHAVMNTRRKRLRDARDVLERLVIDPLAFTDLGLQVPRDGRRRTAWTLLGSHLLPFQKLAAVYPALLASINSQDFRALESDSQYEIYLERQRKEIDAFRQEEAVPIPSNFDYELLKSVSSEEREKLSAIRPDTLGKASRIPGIRPSTLHQLLIISKRNFSADRTSSTSQKL